MRPTIHKTIKQQIETLPYGNHETHAPRHASVEPKQLLKIQSQLQV